MIESHIHLAHFKFEQEFPFISRENGEFAIETGTREDVIARLQAAGVTACIDPAIDIEYNRKALVLAAQYPGFVFAAVGVHPTRTYVYQTRGKNEKAVTKKLRLRDRKRVQAYAGCSGVVAVGETGLDYHLPRREQHRLRQKLWFVWQLRLAHREKLPVILHIREADADAVKILQRHRRLLEGGVCHCFSGTPVEAEIYTKMGLKLGIGGALLAEGGRRVALEQVIRQTPLEYILLETDGPYVKPDCPEGISGKQWKKARNTSLILPAVAERIAQLKGISVEEVESVTTENAKELFFRR